MTDQKQETDRLDNLRQRAEDVLRQQPDALREMPPEDIQTLIHDLEVHQVELRMQNEELRRIQQDLERARDRYMDLYDFAPVGYLSISETGLILEANLTAATMLGTERGLLIKQPLSRLIAWEDQDNYYLHRRKLCESQEPQVYEIRMVRKDSVQFWARIHTSVSVDSQRTETVRGEALCRATMSDITERKQAEETLRQTTERLQIQHEIDTAILATQSPEETARTALSRLQRLIPYQRASITEIDPAQQQGRDLIVLRSDGELRTDNASWQPLSNAGQQLIATIQRGQTYQVRDIAALETPSTMEQQLLASRMRAYVSVPLLMRTVGLFQSASVRRAIPVGILSLASDIPDFFQAEHVEILEKVAASLSVALQQARLLEQTQRDAEMKTLLLHEVNHRVLNNLTMILSILDIERRRPLENKADFQAKLRDVASRIDGITTVHRMLSSTQWAPLELGELVAKMIHAALSGSPIQSDVEVLVDAPDAPLYVASKHAITVALIINELTTNSIKYAFRDRAQGRIHVQITAPGSTPGSTLAPSGPATPWHGNTLAPSALDADNEREKVRMVFRDDGPGLPDKVLAGEQYNVGLRLVNASVKHSLRHGEIDLRNEGGLVVSITFEPHEDEVSPFIKTRR